MYKLYDYKFMMQLRGGHKQDVWALCGLVYGHSQYDPGTHIFVSAPVSFDEETNTVTTRSGSEYMLIDCAGNPDEVHREIREVVARGNYSRH